MSIAGFFFLGVEYTVLSPCTIQLMLKVILVHTHDFRSIQTGDLGFLFSQSLAIGPPSMINVSPIQWIGNKCCLWDNPL